MSYSKEQFAVLAVLQNAVVDSRLPLDTDTHGIVNALGRAAKLELVATEAAAMLAETNHGGLSRLRSVSTQAAGVLGG